MQNILDRTKAPEVKPIGSFSLPTVNIERVKNTSLFSYKSDATPLVRIQIVFDYGTIDTTRAGLLSFYSTLANDEAGSYNHLELKEKIAFYGSAIEISPGHHHTTFTLYSQSKFASSLISLLFDVIISPSLAEERIDSLKQKALQSQLIQEEKTSFWNTYHFNQSFYAKGHPYGFVRTTEDIKSITQAELINIKEGLLSRQTNCFVAGDYDTAIIDVLKENLLKLNHSNSNNNRNENVLSNEAFQIYKEKKGSVQSSLKMGISAINRSHADYHALYLANIIFGGYFGSRLMQNIREEKGYTYGIYSQFQHLKLSSQIIIGADVVKKHNQDVIDEIKKELIRLQEEQVSIQELNSAREYIKGKILNSIGTAFQVMDKASFLFYENLPQNYYQQLFTKLDSVQVDDILTVAKKHLSTDFSYCIYG